MSEPASLLSVLKALSPEHVGFLCMVGPPRLGCRAFVVFLEYRHFPPRSPQNDEFQLFQMHWEMLEFLIVIIPRAKQPLADAILAELGLKTVRGVPVLTTVEGNKRFPIDPPNLFYVENIPGHFVYKNDPGSNKTAYQLESEACEREFAKYEPVRR